MNIESIKHNQEKRAYIPSSEDAGAELASPQVSKDNTQMLYPKNPVVSRGNDPELFWLGKYGEDDRDDILNVDIRSLYRHEHIAPETLIERMYRLKEETTEQEGLFSVNELFGNAIEVDELDKISDYYKHSNNWTNRIIQGDSLLVMTSLLEREGMAGKVQCVYIDPPYGIKYGSNWQININDRNITDGKDEHLSGEPEQIKAYRDTWELGIHSYLSYLRDRLLAAKELLTESGSCFVQISDENVHLVRCLMDEVFGSENFVNQINFRRKISVMNPKYLGSVNDYIIFYAKDIEILKYRQLFKEQEITINDTWSIIEEKGKLRKPTSDEKRNPKSLNPEAKICASYKLAPAGFNQNANFEVEYKNKKYIPPMTSGGRSWKTNENGMKKLVKLDRVIPQKNTLRFKAYFDDFPYEFIDHSWESASYSTNKSYVVETSSKIIERCILMTTDPGDLVLDPTCGSGTTAYAAEHWGRRWITIDTSRIAVNIAKTRLMTAVFPYYRLYSDVNIKKLYEKDGQPKRNANGSLKIEIRDKPENEKQRDIRQGFVYEEVPHITLKSLANDEPPATETLFDKPYEDKKVLRVAGAFTVDTLQNFEPVSPGQLTTEAREDESNAKFEQRVFEHLMKAGVKNGLKNETAVFIRIDRLSNPYIHAEGFYETEKGERKAYFHIGQKFGTVSREAVNQAIRECRSKGDAGWLIILGFSFESNIQNAKETWSMGQFEVTKARMHDDLMQDGLLKKDKKAGSFITIGEPDIKVHKTGGKHQLEIAGLDIYDPISDTVKARSVKEIAYWMVDDDYDGSNFIARQVFFCGGGNEFDKWKKELDAMSRQKTKVSAEKTLKIEIDDEVFDRLYGFMSHPIEKKKEHQRAAVRVVSQFGEESTKVVELEV